MEIILNKCFGGYGISAEAIKLCRDAGATWAQWPNSFLPGEKYEEGSDEICDRPYVPYEARDSSRTCPILIKLVKDGTTSVNDRYAKLEVVDIPEGVAYEISEYDGIESVEAPRQIWG